MTPNEVLVYCKRCGHTWPAAALDQIHDYWSRVDPGSVVPLGQCPDPDCGALCYPSYGYVCELEQRLATLQDILSRLLAWAEYMGGWEAPVWDEARRLHTLVRSPTRRAPH
jgi:hypothetical protein